MVLASRAMVAAGLCSVGLGFLVSQSLGQQQQAQDAGVRRTANNNTTPAAGGPSTPVPAVIGTIDMDAVFKDYEKVKNASEEFKAAALTRKAELTKISEEAKQVGEVLAKMAPNSAEAKKQEDKLTELKARFEAGRESAEREFAGREAESMATLYNEVQAMVKRVAEWRHMTYIVKISKKPVVGSDPNSVMAAMANTMVYADLRNDITNDVVHNLNRMYKATGGTTAPKGAANTAAPAPAATTAPAPADPGN